VTTRAIAFGAAALLMPAQVSAAPDLRQGRPAGAVMVYPDSVAPYLYYYGPGDLTIAGNETEGPDLHLLHARYTGSAATGDRGTIVVRSLFTVRVLMNGPTPVQLAAARSALTSQIGRAIELRPLPLRRIESALVYAPVERTEPQAIAGGHFDAPEDARPPRDGYWTERTYTLGLAPADAQLLSDSLEHGRLAISIGYAFLADGIGTDQPLEMLTGSPELVDALSKQLKLRAAAGADTQASGPHVVRAGAMGITADLEKWPRLVRRVDINEAAPPGYAALDIYCYDFSQGTNEALYEKQVEIAAAGTGGGSVSIAVVFNRAQPDVSARSVRFPVAVRLDKPYRFRVRSVMQDGTETTTPWQERASWSELLDVTAQSTRTIGAPDGAGR
jgi:hypothetical protein